MEMGGGGVQFDHTWTHPAPCPPPTPGPFRARVRSSPGRVYDQYSGSIKIPTHLGHVGHCKTASGENSSSKWTYRASIIIPLASRLLTQTKVESGTSERKSGISVDFR